MRGAGKGGVSTVDISGLVFGISGMGVDVRDLLTCPGVPLTLTLSPKGRGDAGCVVVPGYRRREGRKGGCLRRGYLRKDERAKA